MSKMKGPPVWRVRTYIMMASYDHIAYAEHKAQQVYSDAQVAMKLAAGAIQRIELIRGAEIVGELDWRARPLTPKIAEHLALAAESKRRDDGVLEVSAKAAYGALMWGGNCPKDLESQHKPKPATSTEVSLEDMGL